MITRASAAWIFEGTRPLRYPPHPSRTHLPSSQNSCVWQPFPKSWPHPKAWPSACSPQWRSISQPLQGLGKARYQMPRCTSLCHLGELRLCPRAPCPDRHPPQHPHPLRGDSAPLRDGFERKLYSVAVGTLVHHWGKQSTYWGYNANKQCHKRQHG